MKSKHTTQWSMYQIFEFGVILHMIYFTWWGRKVIIHTRRSNAHIIEDIRDNRSIMPILRVMHDSSVFEFFFSKSTAFWRGGL